MLNLRKKIIFSFLSSLMILSLLACSSEATPKSPDIEVPVQAKVKEILDSMPPTSTLAPTPRPVVKPTVVVVAQPTPTATPMSTARPTSIPLLEAFDGTAYIVLQIGEAVHELNWNLINNSQQEIIVVTAEMHRANGSVIARDGVGNSIVPSGELDISTSFIKLPTQEEVMAYQWVWTIRIQTGETIVCTFTKTNPKSCVYTTVEVDISKYENLSLDELKEQAVGTNYTTLGFKYPDKITENFGNLVWFKGEIDEIVPFVEVDRNLSELKSITGKESLPETRVGRNWVWFCDFKRRPCNSPVLLEYDATTESHLHPGEKVIVAGVIKSVIKRSRRIATGSYIYDKIQDAPRMTVVKIEIIQE